MAGFIIFNTSSQMENYVKRLSKQAFHHNDGCGCCWSSSDYHVDDNNRVINVHTNSYQDNMSTSVTVLGRLKK